MKFVIGVVVNDTKLYVKSDNIWVPPKTLFTDNIDLAFLYKTEQLALERSRCLKVLAGDDRTWGTGFSVNGLDFKGPDIHQVSVLTVKVTIVTISSKLV